MNSPFNEESSGATTSDIVAGAQAIQAFLPHRDAVAPFEFRSLPSEQARDVMELIEQQCEGSSNPSPINGSAHDRAAREGGMRNAIEAARQLGVEDGEREGRRTGRTEMEAELNLALAQERQQVLEAVRQFRAARERYFAEVEQEVVKLALAVAARVLHREAQMDPLLLTGVVRVALEKMADRSGVVLRVAGCDVEAWERVFHSTEDAVRPRVAEDARLDRGECVLETRMGTVELGVRVQLEEIEKGFFDLLNHRPVE